MELDRELKIFEQFTMPDYGDIAAVRRWYDSFPVPAIPDAGARITLSDRRIPGPDAGGLRIRIYRPEGPAVLPVLLYFHGGSMIMGNLDTDRIACVNYARDAECAVVTVDYRLAPEHPYPAAVEDGYAALAWLAENAASFNGDAKRIAIGGSSAGGTLAAALALMARDRRRLTPVLQLLVYPALDDRMATASMNHVFQPSPLPKSIIGHMWRYYLGEAGIAASAYAAPARANDFSGLAPAYLEVGALDPLRDEVIHYATRLLQAGVPSDLHVLAGAPHGFDMVAGAEITRRAFAYRAAALRKAFGSERSAF